MSTDLYRLAGLFGPWRSELLIRERLPRRLGEFADEFS